MFLRLLVSRCAYYPIELWYNYGNKYARGCAGRGQESHTYLTRPPDGFLRIAFPGNIQSRRTALYEALPCGLFIN
jgi:hypothetical protein